MTSPSARLCTHICTPLLCTPPAQLELLVVCLGAHPCLWLSLLQKGCLPVPLPAPVRRETLPAQPRLSVVHPAQDDGCHSSCRQRQLSSCSKWENKTTGRGPHFPPYLPPQLPGQGRTSAGEACGAELLVGWGQRHGMLLQPYTGVGATKASTRGQVESGGCGVPCEMTGLWQMPQ